MSVDFSFITGVIEWVKSSLAGILDAFISDYLLEAFKHLVPNATEQMASIVLFVVAMIILWTKADWITNVIKILITVIMVVLSGVFVLMLLGLV